MTLCCTPQVYFPREDSELLARAAANHAFGKVLDMGCGTGIVGINATRNPAVTEIVFADCNLEAVKCAKENAKANGVRRARFVKTNLFSALEKEEFDCICFNPPYLPSDPEDCSPTELKLAWDGGADGRSVIDLFLAQFPEHLKENGVLLLVDCSLNDSKKTEQALSRQGFEFSVLETQSFFFERLRVLKASKKTHLL
ncbi:MAG: HemK2/MTQ2 family protein methyltransferase [Candidatus Micrarchaeia archaeon]|jgi:release factor glutamine methyltransferase